MNDTKSKSNDARTCSDCGNEYGTNTTIGRWIYCWECDQFTVPRSQ